MTAMSEWISFGASPPLVTSPYCRDQVELIAEVRRRAAHHFPLDTDWNLEYVTPLFVVSIGLLQFLSEFRNQEAAKHTILQLARYLSNSIGPVAA